MSQIRIPLRRTLSTVARPRYRLPISRLALPRALNQSSRPEQGLLGSVSSVAVRHYASGRPQPPGGTHRMNLGGEPEKSALEQYGVDLTARARDGKLDPVHR